MVEFSRLAGVMSRTLGGPESVVWRPAGGDPIPLAGAIVDRGSALAVEFEADDVGVEGEAIVVHVATALVSGLAKGAAISIDGGDHVVSRDPCATPDGMTRLVLRKE